MQIFRGKIRIEMFLVLLPNSVVKLDYNLQNENAHYLIENSSKTKFIYTATQ